MRLVIIESPYTGDVELHVAYARKALLDSLRRGEAPIASHLLYTQVLDDAKPEERAHGIAAGLAWRRAPVLPAFYVDLGWSSGMERARRMYRDEGIAYEVRSMYGHIAPSTVREEP